MRIGGPKPPITPPLPPAASGPAGPIRPGTGSFAEQLVRGTAATERPGSTQGAAAALTTIAERVRSGEIGRREAVGLLVDKVLKTRAAGLPPAAQAKLQETLQRLLEDDPTLAAQVGRIRAKE